METNPPAGGALDPLHYNTQVTSLYEKPRNKNWWVILFLSLSLFYDINKLDLACNLQSPASGKEQKGEMGPRFVLFSTARSMACIRRRHCCHRCTKDSIIGKEWQRVPVLEVLRATDSSTA